MGFGPNLKNRLGLEELPNIPGFPIVFLQQLGLAASNLTHRCGLPRRIIKSHAEERVGVVWVRGALPNLRVFLQYLHNG